MSIVIVLLGLSLPSSRGFSTNKRHDRAAKAHCPTVISIGEEHTLERMWSTTAFPSPMLPAVAGLDNRSFRTDGPAFQFVDKLHVKQIDGDARCLSLPGATTVYCAIDAAATAHRPSSSIIDKRSGREPNCFFNLRQG